MTKMPERAAKGTGTQAPSMESLAFYYSAPSKLAPSPFQMPEKAVLEKSLIHPPPTKKGDRVY